MTRASAARTPELVDVRLWPAQVGMTRAGVERAAQVGRVAGNRVLEELPALPALPSGARAGLERAGLEPVGRSLPLILSATCAATVVATRLPRRAMTETSAREMPATTPAPSPQCR